jgi:hypothetical protein
VVVRTGAAALKRSLPAALADDRSELFGEMRELLCEMSQWLRTLEQRIASCEARITLSTLPEDFARNFPAFPQAHLQIHTPFIASRSCVNVPNLQLAPSSILTFIRSPCGALSTQTIPPPY